MRDELKIIVSAETKINEQKSIQQLNSDIRKIEAKINKLKLTATLDSSKSKAEIQKQIETLNKQRKKLYVDLQLRKDTLKKQYKELQRESNLSLNVNTENTQRQIKNVSQTMGDTKNETVGLGLALKNAFANSGLILSANSALNLVRKAANEATQAVKEYNEYTKNLKIITNKDDVSDLIADYATKSIDMKIDISEYESASEVILRAGKNLAESAEYTDTAIKLAKTGFIETDTAAENLITIANSYDLTADKLKNVTDALLTLDVKTNTEAGALSSAMAKSAKNAQLAGLSYEQLGSIIAKLRDTTGKSETEIATSLNNIFNRTYRVKPNSFTFENEDGETEDLSKPLSDVEKVVNQLGISIRKSATEFKDFEDIISTIAPIWKDLDSVSQNAISSVFAGQHKNVFLNLVNDWQDIVKLTETAKNSAGVTESKYTAYLDSIESKTAEFSTSAKELWNNLLPTDFVGDITDAGTSIVQFTDKYQILQTALKSAVFYGLAKGAIAAKNSLVGMATDIKNVSYAMDLASKGSSLTGNQFKELQTIASVLSDSQLKLILNTDKLTYAEKLQIVQTKNMTTAEAEQRLATLGITQANQQATTATFSLSGAFKTLLATIAANPVMALTIAFTAVSTIITTVKQKQEELRQSISDSAQAAKEQTDKLNDLIKSYEEFANKVTYTAEEKEKLKSIQEQLVEAYYTEIDEIDLVNGKYDEQIEKLRQLKKEKLEEAELSLIAEREQANKDASYNNLPNKSFNISADWFQSDNDYQKIIKELNERVSGFTTDISLIAKGTGIDSQINLFAGNAEYRIEQLQEAMAVLKENGYANIGLYSELNKLLSEYKTLEDTENSAIINLAENKFQQFALDNPFNKVNGKEAYSAWKNTLLETAKGDTDLQDELSQLAERQFPDYQKYFDDIAELKTKYVDTTVDVSKAISKMTFINSLSDEDLEIATQIPNLFKDGLDGATKIIEDWKNNSANKISANIDTKSLEDLKEAYDELSKSASTYTSNQKTFTEALEEQEKHGQLSASTIQSLTEAGYAQALVINEETGAVTFNIAKYEQLNAVKKQEIILEAKQQESDLTQHLKDEQQAMSDLILEQKYANEERKKAIALELSQHGLAMENIREQLAAIDTLTSSLTAPEFDDKKKKDEKPQQVVDFEEELARRQHEINMGRMEEDSEYYDWLESASQKAYTGLEDYQDDLWKYEEEVYKGRERLAQEAFDKEHDLFEKRVDELEDYADKLSETSVTSDGTQLTTQEKWREVAAVYEEIRSEIEREINRIVQVGVEGNEDLLEELEKKLEEYSEKITDTFNNAVEAEKDLLNKQKSALSDIYDGQLDKIKQQQEDAENAANAEIDLIQQKIDSLKKVNDEKQQEYDLEKARQELEKASQRTRMVYGADGTVTYRADNDAIQEAQQNFDKILLEKQVNSLEEQKSLLEDMRDKESESYDKMIEDLESQKEQDERQFDILIQRLDDYLNPNTDTSNVDVWTTLAKMDGASYKNGKWIDKDGTEIDIAALINKANEISDKVDKVDSSVKADSKNDKNLADKINSSNDNIKHVGLDKDCVKSNGITLLKDITAEEMFAKMCGLPINWVEIRNNAIKQGTAIQNNPVTAVRAKQNEEINNANSVINNNSDNTRNVTVTINGGITISNPVGNSNDLAKEILLNLDNEMDKLLYR